MLAGNQSVLAVAICSCSCLSLPTLATRNVLQRSLILLVLAWNRTWSLHNLLLQLVNASANALPNLTVTGILTVLMGNVFFQQLSFLLRKTLGNKRWTFPYQLFFLSGSWPGSWGCVLALLARHISPRVSPGGTMLSLLLLPRVTDKLSPADATRGIQGAQPLAHYTFFFFPKKKTLPVLHTSFLSSRRSSCHLPVLSRWITTACCFLMPPKLFDFFLWLFYQSLYKTYSFPGSSLF